jgi:hypothetical protein
MHDIVIRRATTVLAAGAPIFQDGKDTGARPGCRLRAVG